jgi:sulfur-oxidizing protein SoxY
MSMNRREVLKVGGGAAVYSALASMGFFAANPAMAAWNKDAFATKTIAETLKVLGVSGTANSADISITAPDIAENGAVVPVGVSSKLAGTDMIAVMIEKNPAMMAGMYNFMAGAEADISMRCKMGQSTDVYALVKAGGKYYMTKKEIKVTLGGCGG